VVDFDAATLDPATGGLKMEFVPDSTAGGPGDKLHPNRTGYHAMGLRWMGSSWLRRPSHDWPCRRQLLARADEVIE
jgi:hypothetical protein